MIHRARKPRRHRAARAEAKSSAQRAGQSAVAAGDVLFEIDPADYELTLQKAKAALSTLDQQIRWRERRRRN